MLVSVTSVAGAAHIVDIIISITSVARIVCIVALRDRQKSFQRDFFSHMWEDCDFG